MTQTSEAELLVVAGDTGDEDGLPLGEIVVLTTVVTVDRLDVVITDVLPLLVTVAVTGQMVV